MRRMRTIAETLLLLSISLILVSVSPTVAQEFQIRTRVDLVVVPFSVKGADDALIGGMAAADFTLVEDEVEQTIQSFSIDPVPLSAAVVIDTGVDRDSLTAIQEAIPSIVFGFGPLDEVAVYRYDNTVEEVQDFTENPEVLRAALDELKAFRPTPQFLGGTAVQPGPSSTAYRRSTPREFRSTAIHACFMTLSINQPWHCATAPMTDAARSSSSCRTGTTRAAFRRLKTTYSF